MDHPTPWQAFVPPARHLGTLEGAMSGAHWAEPQTASAAHRVESAVPARSRMHHSRYSSLLDSFGRLDLFVEIQQFADLSEDWDGDGASSISGEAIDAARRFVSALPIMLSAEAAPNPNGTISIYLEDSRTRAEMEIGRTRFTWSVVRDGAPVVSHSGDISEIAAGADVQQLISMFAPQPMLVVLSSDYLRQASAMNNLGRSYRYLHEWR